MPSSGSGTAFTWTCPDCGRRVPKAVPACRCGNIALATLEEPDFPSEADAESSTSETASRRRATTVPGGTISINRQDLAFVADALGLGADTAERLWNGLCVRGARRQRFDAAHVAYYFGALVVVSAMGFFMTLAWDAVGGLGLTTLALAYGIAFWFAGNTLWRRGLSTPGGLLFTIAVCMTPLAVYGVQNALGLWVQGDPGRYREYYSHVRGSWITIELMTIAVGTGAILLRPFPFLTAPIAVALWFMSMDLTPLIFGKQEFTWGQREWVSVWFGLAMLLVSYWIDLRNRLRHDFAFWGYLFGVLAFWGGLSLMDSDSELSKLLYCVINLALIIFSVLLRQRSFIVFGSLGVLGYLGHLSYRVFEDSLLFPIALTFLGVLIIYAGVLYQRNASVITERLQAKLPADVRALVPPRARSF